MKCNACGKHYDYHEHGCCPKCGAYNRPAQRDRVGADGVVHHMSDEDFLGNSAKRRRAQEGKVCFEREECHEDAVRVKETAKKWIRWAEELFDDGSQEKSEESADTARFTSQYDGHSERRRATSGNKDVGKIVLVVMGIIVAVNVLTAVLSVVGSVGSGVSTVISGIVSGIVDADPARPEPVGQYYYNTYTMWEDFYWCNQTVWVESASLEETDNGTSLLLTVGQEDETDEVPVIHFTDARGQYGTVKPEEVNDLGGYFTYVYYLPPLDLEQEVKAVFWYYDGSNTHESEVLLNVEGVVELQPVVYEAQLGERFLWWGEETAVVGATMENHPNLYSTHLVQAVVTSDSWLDEPRLVYYPEGVEKELLHHDVYFNGEERTFSYLMTSYNDDMPLYLRFLSDDLGQQQEVLVQIHEPSQ